MRKLVSIALSAACAMCLAFVGLAVAVLVSPAPLGVDLAVTGAWAAWGEQPDAFFAHAYGEAVGWKPGNTP